MLNFSLAKNSTYMAHVNVGLLYAHTSVQLT